MILSRPRLLPQERFDLEDFNALLAAGRSDAKYYTAHFLSDHNYVEQGFVVSGLGLKNATVAMADATAILPQGTSDFSWYVAASSEPNVIIPEAELTPNVRNYVEIQLTTQNNTPLTRAFWDPEADAGAGAEFNQIVATITDLEASFVVLTGGFSGSPDSIPLAIMDVDNLGNIQTILDRRPLFHRLSTPDNLLNNYAWGVKQEPPYSLTMIGVVGTFLANEALTINTETATVVTGGTTAITFNSPSGINFFPGSAVTGSTSGATGVVASIIESFSGVDKSLKNQKNMFDALMTEIKLLKGSNYWWQTVGTGTSTTGLMNQTNSEIVQAVLHASWAWDGSNMSIKDVTIPTPAASDILAYVRFFGLAGNVALSRQDGTGGSATIPVAEKQVVFIKLPAAGTSRQYSGVGTGDTNFQVVDIASFVPGDNIFWLAYRELNSLYTRFYGDLETGDDVPITDPISPQELAAAIAAAQAASSQDRNLKLVRGGNWNWTVGTNTLMWDADATIQIPGVSEAMNTIPAGNVVLPLDGDVAYVEVNRVSGVPAPLVVSVAQISALVFTNNTTIIARRVGNNVIVGSHSFNLADQETKQLDFGLSNDSLKLIGGITIPVTEATSLPDFSGRGAPERTIDDTQSILDAQASMDAEIDKFFGQLRIIPHESDISKVRITSADKTMKSGSILSQEFNGLLIEFDGAIIDFNTGIITHADGTTPMGTNFAPATVPVGQYVWYGITAVTDTVDTNNAQKMKISIVPSAPDTLPNVKFPTLADGKKSGAVLIQNLANVPTRTVIRELGAGSGSGSGGGSVQKDIVSLLPKGHAFCYTDGSTEELNCNPPTIVSATQIQLLLNFDIDATDFAEVYVDERFIPLFVNEATTPSTAPWYRITLPNTLLINAPATPAKSLEVRTFYSTVPVIPSPALEAGLQQKGRSIIESDGSGTPYNATVDSTSGKTVVAAVGYTIDIDDVIFVDYNDEYVPQYVDDNTTPGLAWSWADATHIAFTQDISGTVAQIDIRVYQGASFLDEYGNFDVKLEPTLNPVILLDSTSQRWILGASNDGSVTAETVATGLANPYRLKRLVDNVIVGLEITTFGELQVNDSPTPGILVDLLNLQAPNGTVFSLGVTQLNEIYLQDGLGNKFILRNGADEIVKQIGQTGLGTIEQTKFFPDVSDLPNPPELVAGAIPTAWANDPAQNKVVQFVYTDGAWRPFLISESAKNHDIGDVWDSMLTQAQMDAIHGAGNVIISDGRGVTGSLYSTMTGFTSVPDFRGNYRRGKNNGRNDTLGNPDGDLALGTYQVDQNQSHTHTYGAQYNLINRDAPIHFETRIDLSWNVLATTLASGGNEARPRTITVNTFIRIN